MKNKANDLRCIIMEERARLAATGNFSFDEREHIYRMYGQIVPSVTKIISTISPDLLMNSNFIRKTQIGTDTHSVCEHLIDAQMGWGSVGYPELNPIAVVDAQTYVDGFIKFMDKEDYIFIASELRVHSELYKVAGTMDILALHKKKGHLALMDIKTVAKLSPTVALQLWAYDKFYWEMFGKLTKTKVKERTAIWLTGDGDYKLKHYNDANDVNVFMCKLVSYQWDKANKIK